MLAGATNNPLSLPNVSLADAGLYTVVVSNALGTVTSSAARLTVVPRLSVAVFDDERYVNSSGGQYAASDAVQAALQQIGHIVRPFTNLLAAITNDLMLFPEFGNRQLVPDLDETSRRLLQAYVAEGGVIIVQGYYANVDLLNSVFDFSMQPNGWWSGVTFSRTAEANGTPFGDDPASFPANYYTYSVYTASLPPGALSLYTYSDQTGVALIPYGGGALIYLGWDWYDAAPLGAQDGGWNQVLASAVQTRISLAPPTTISLPLITLHSVWSYLDNGTDQGTAWRELNFDDSSWGYGQGQLGYGDGDEWTVVSYGPDPNNKYPTTYFRHAFTFDGPAVSNLTVRLLRDDGAVVYLNGSEVFRSNMPDIPITYRTFSLATISGDEENQFITALIDPTSLRVGTNVIAVEIHQANLTSSDISFELELTGGLPIGAPVVRRQPEGRNVLRGAAVVLDVIAIGAPPLNYQWLLDTQEIPGATNGILVISGITPSQAGVYSVRLTNPLGSIVSSNAVVQVITLGGDTFRIADLSTNNALVVDDSPFSGDTRGGIATSSENVFYTGDFGTARFAIADLSGGTNLSVYVSNGVSIYYNALVSDLKTERIYSLASDGGVLDTGGGIATTLLELDRNTGELTGTSIQLSEPIDLRNRYGQVAIFAGFGRIVVYDGTRAWDVGIPSGLVVDLGAVSLSNHAYTETWASWGVAECCELARKCFIVFHLAGIAPHVFKENNVSIFHCGDCLVRCGTHDIRNKKYLVLSCESTRYRRH